jgi:hypothetical protein
MKKHLCTLSLFLVSLMAFPLSNTKADDDVIVGDDDSPDGKVTYITLQWDPNSENDIAGYNVYWGRTTGVYVKILTVLQPAARVGVRGTNIIYFAVTAFDSSGLESDFSNEVHYP